MTKRDFDRETKANFHGEIARDERASYRKTRLLEHSGSGAHGAWYPYGPADYLAYRQAKMGQLRRVGCEGVTLGRGSPLRAPQAYRAATGQSLLDGRLYYVG